jgi:tripartite-type tricarboxylate transporter receptor subunit TctC
MKLSYRSRLNLGALALLMGLSFLVNAQEAASSYPSKTVKIISPFAPGGATDILARILGQKLGEAWKQSIIVDNKSGGGGVIAAAEVARAEKDGYTLLLGSVGPVEVLPYIMKKVEKIQGGILGETMGNGTYVSEESCLPSKMPYKLKSS